MEDLEYIIQHSLHCLNDMCVSPRGTDEYDCRLCEDAFRRGYQMGYNTGKEDGAREGKKAGREKTCQEFRKACDENAIIHNDNIPVVCVLSASIDTIIRQIRRKGA